MAKITFSNSNNDFYQSVKASVEAYFTENKIKKTGDWRLFSKTIILVTVALAMGCFFVALLACLPGVSQRQHERSFQIIHRYPALAVKPRAG